MRKKEREKREHRPFPPMDYSHLVQFSMELFPKILPPMELPPLSSAPLKKTPEEKAFEELSFNFLKKRHSHVLCGADKRRVLFWCFFGQLKIIDI